MAKGSEIWVCPRCRTQVDIAPLGLYAEVCCPNCLHTARVHMQLGNFRLDRVLGVGGMSVVYRAMDVVLNRPLALKVLNDTFRDQPERIERFENESAMMARVRHENVTSVYSAGRAYGQFYIAMELVEGKNLEHMVSVDHPLAPLFALDIIGQVANGLRAAQKAGLLHRDMKPGNILITPSGKAKVIDFGLAVDSVKGDTEEIIWATPYYVPPETLKREPEDMRTDIYALGMTLRYLLTGIEQFEGPTDSLTALLETKKAQPSFAKQRPDMDSQLTDFVDHMTEFSPSKRPANYDEVLEELREVQAHLTELQIDQKQLEKKRSSAIFRYGAIAASIGLGIGLALFVSSHFNGYERYKSVPLETFSSTNPDESALRDALLVMQQGKYDQAASDLLKLAEETSEPGMGAWAALLVQRISGLCTLQDEHAEEKAFQLLTKHLAQSEHAAPAALPFLNYIREHWNTPPWKMNVWLQEKETLGCTNEAELAEAIRKLEGTKLPAVVEQMEWYRLALRALRLGSDSQLSACCDHVKKVTPNLGDYSGFAPLYESNADLFPLLRNILAHEDMLRLMQQVASSGPSTAFLDSLKKIADDASLAPRVRTMARIRVDATNLAQHMSALLCRHLPTRCKDGMSLDAMLNQIGKDPGLPDSPKFTVSSQQLDHGHTAERAMDGDLLTRWCANDGHPGHSWEVTLPRSISVGNIVIYWEHATKQHVVLVASDRSGKSFSKEFEKDSDTSTIPLDGMSISSLRLTMSNTGAFNWACIREVKFFDPQGNAIAFPPDTSSRIPSPIIADIYSVNQFFRVTSQQQLLQQHYLGAKDCPHSQDFLTIVKGWQELLKKDPEPLSSSFQKLYSLTPESVNTIIHLCRRARLVTVLPGKSLVFDIGMPTWQGMQTILTDAQARYFRERGLVRVEDQEMVAMLGLKQERHMNFTLLQGVIQPVPRPIAEHFRDTGAGRLLLSADDLEGCADFLSERPLSFLLLRTPDFS